MLSRKQELLRDLLCQSLSFIRNRQTLPWWRKAFDKAVYFESELVHNISPSIFNSDFTDHDIWFINHQAKWYIENCTPEISPNYDFVKKTVEELIGLVPPSLAHKIQNQCNPYKAQ